MKDIHELKSAVLFYCSKHGYMPKYKKILPDEKYIFIEAMDYTQLEAKIVPMKSGKTKVVFKVDGKVASLYK